MTEMPNHTTEADITGEVDKSSCSRQSHESNARGGALVLDSTVFYSGWSLAFRKRESEPGGEDNFNPRSHSSNGFFMDCSRV